LLGKPPYKLSLGEKRIVTLASILAYDPELLLLDEPTVNLSSRTIEEIKEVVEDSRKNKRAVVVASHDVEFVAEISDRVYVIKDRSTLRGSDARTILTNESLLALADTKPPLVLQTLKLLNLKLQNYPLTIKDLEKAAIAVMHDDQRSSRKNENSKNTCRRQNCKLYLSLLISTQIHEPSSVSSILPVLYPSRSSVIYLNPKLFSSSAILSITSVLKKSFRSSFPTSILARPL